MRSKCFLYPPKKTKIKTIMDASDNDQKRFSVRVKESQNVQFKITACKPFHEVFFLGIGRCSAATAAKHRTANNKDCQAHQHQYNHTCEIQSKNTHLKIVYTFTVWSGGRPRVSGLSCFFIYMFMSVILFIWCNFYKSFYLLHFLRFLGNK